MLHIERSTAPKIFQSAKFIDARKRLRKFFLGHSVDHEQTRFQFLLPGKYPGVLKALEKLFRGKCAYCEQPIENANFFNVDSFRPKHDAINADGKSSPSHYWWLAYEWTNLYFACAVCNKLKAARFPVKGRRAKIEGDVSEERPLLLDPCVDYPETVLLFNEDGRTASDDQRGRTTIDACALNRTELIKARSHALSQLRKEWESAVQRMIRSSASAKDVRMLTDARFPFAAMRRQFLQLWSRELVAEQPQLFGRLRSALVQHTALPGDGQSVVQTKSSIKSVESEFKKSENQRLSSSVEDESRKADYYGRSQLIERIEIKNFRVLRDMSIDFPLDTQDRGSWLLLLGENGTGKTSVLQAIALALMSTKDRSRLVRHLDPSSFVRKKAQSGFVRVFLTGQTEPIELEVRRKAPYFRSRFSSAKVLLLGYGATRLLPRRHMKQLETRGSSKADNLFDPFVALSNGVPWLYELPSREFNQIARSLKVLLPQGDRIRLKTVARPHRHLEAVHDGSSIPLNDLSAGYRSIVALAIDIMSVLRLRWNAMESAEGIVLIDEIDAHLHPVWKMQIVDKLRQVFPRLQFLVTSHEPLTLRGLHDGEVAVMRRCIDGNVAVITELPSPRTLRIDQILTSEFFGLNTTADAETEVLFQEYYDLLALAKPQAKQRARTEELRNILNDRQMLGRNRRERLMLEAADRFIAKADGSSADNANGVHRRSVESRLQAMWESI